MVPCDVMDDRRDSAGAWKVPCLVQQPPRTFCRAGRRRAGLNDGVTWCRSSGGQQPGRALPSPMVSRYGSAVLQDLAVAVADAAADAYLAEAGVSRQGRQLLAMPLALLPASCSHCMLTRIRALMS